MLTPLLLPPSSNPFEDLAGVSLDIDNGVSNLLGERVPQFVAIDHTTFVEFLKQYYEWMEEEGNPKYVSNRLLDYRDVDDTLDSLVVRFMNEFGDGVPTLLAFSETDKRKMIKRLIDFYRAKGTEKSYKTLFRLLFDEDPLLYYPSEDILRLSSGRWEQPTTIKTTANMTVSQAESMVGRRIEQAGFTAGTVTSYGFVEEVRVRTYTGYDLLEIELSGVFGTFIPEKDVTCTLNDGTVLTEHLFPVLNTIGISTQGKDYKVGDEVLITGSSLGVGAKVYVSSVGPSGGVRGFDILDTGVNYTAADGLTATISTDGQGTGGVLLPTGGAGTRKSEGYWKTDDGLLSSSKRLQDNNYYQDFSYVVRSSLNLSEYKDVTKKMVHPAGFRQFGEYLISQTVTAGATSAKTSTTSEVPVIGHYAVYRHETIRNLRANGVGGSGGNDLYPGGYGWSAAQGNTYIPETAVLVPSFPTGASGELGGVTHVTESIGVCGASEGPGGTANSVQFGQFGVTGGLTGFNHIHSTVTGGAWWVIYPHPHARDIKELPYARRFDVARLLVSRDEEPSVGEPDLGYDVGEIVRQKVPNSQQPVGKVVNSYQSGPYRYLEINLFSGAFIDTDTSVIGGSAGFLEGISSGATAYINNSDNSYDLESSGDPEMGAMKISNFLYDLEKD
jgi:hypothetical protein